MISSQSFACVLIFAAIVAPAVAQTPPDDPASAQAVGLFVQACIPFSGDKDGLRSWIAERHLPQLPTEQAAGFLATEGGGEVFSATNAAGQYALVSYDIGACKVVGRTGDMQAAENILSAYLAKNGFTQTPRMKRERPGAAMQLYHVTREGREWLLSIIGNDGSGASTELDLMATPAGRMPEQ